jgi:uncharacterized membrane protein
MRFDEQVTIDVGSDRVWSVYADVERWPEWTASIETVEFVHGHRVEVGARVRIQQPKLPVAVWEVTEVIPGRSWTWVAKAPGVRTTAVHAVEPLGPGSTEVHQSVIQAGVLGALLGRVWARLTREYLAMEAAGLKARSESTTTA